MQREVVINVLEPGGAAAKDGRLAVGDQILAVSLSTITCLIKSIYLFTLGCLNQTAPQLQFVPSR